VSAESLVIVSPSLKDENELLYTFRLSLDRVMVEGKREEMMDKRRMMGLIIGDPLFAWVVVGCA
jgi:hypothetical protein